MENSEKTVTAVAENEGQYLSVVGDTYRIVITGKQTEGAYAVIDMMVPPNGGPGPHAHANFQETFHVLDGEIEVTTKAKTYVAKKGDFINIPLGGIVHQFKNKSDTVAHLWCVVITAGLEEMFIEIGKPVAAGEYLPPPDLSPDDLQKLQQIAEKHGQKLYPPNYFD